MDLNAAYVFPGQGAQTVGMGRDLYETRPAARDIFDQADEVLGFKLSRLCFEGPLEELTLTQNVQPAVLVTSIACLEAARQESELPPAQFTAGHSLGEYTALVASKVLTFSDALELVVTRSRLMESAAITNPGGMLALIGAGEELAREVCKACGFEISNINSPQQTVISGPAHFTCKATEAAASLGVRKVIPLKVSGAFHSRLMQSAADGLKAVLSNAAIKPAAIPVIANACAVPVSGVEEIRSELEIQLNRPVLWQQSVEYMLKQGIDTFIEFGPGNVLTGLIKRISPVARLFNVSDNDNLIQEWS
ncbi:MAG: ACP S-malonyltransferase [Dehalococcoidaceae bacterium]|nr:ACP S-malonyltransferase [Dehalococcoidaceae bacterium]